MKRLYRNILLTTGFLIAFILIYLVLYLSSIPSEEIGKNNLLLKVTSDIYIVNNLISEEQGIKYILEANKILNRYNISIEQGDIYYIRLNLSEENETLLYSDLNPNCSKEYMPLIKRIVNESNKNKIIFVNNGKSPYNGRGGLCDYSFVLLDKDKLLFFDYTGLDLAHELGHSIGLFDRADGKRNLMNHRNLILKILFKSSFLNQEQINTILRQKDYFLKYS